MVSSDLLMEGLNLMMFGMGFVFLFLTSLVGITTLMSKVVVRYFPDPLPAVAARANRVSAASGNENGELVAAITAAIKMHRNKRS